MTCLISHPLDILTKQRCTSAHIAAYTIQPSLTDIFSLKRIKHELQITPGLVSTRRPFVNENCWLEVGKCKDEALL